MLSNSQAAVSDEGSGFISPRVKNKKSAALKSSENSKNASIWISLSQIGIPYAVYASLSFMFTSQRSSISPSLGYQRVVRNTSPGFKLLWELETKQRTDWDRARQDLVELFNRRQASPKDVDPDGRTWLEVCRMM